MKIKALHGAIAAFVLCCVPAFTQTTPTTWYIRTDGANRAVADGKADAACVGTTPNQHCAFATWNNLFQDGTYTVGGSGATFPSWGWVIAGGDTVIIRGGPYRTGWPNATSALDSATGLYFGWQGDAYDGYNPPIPPGTTAQPTQILGENYATCTPATRTQIYGGYGLYGTLNLKSTQNVVVNCIELTRHSQCIQYGTPAVPPACGTGDDAAGNGALTDQFTNAVTLQNMAIHGFTRAGMLGPIGGTVTLNNTQIQVNGAAGVNFDDGDATPSAVGALFVMANGSAIDWSGCNQAYPGGGVLSCYSQATGGYGDAIGTPDGTCIGFHIDKSFFRHNIQDAADALHGATVTCPYTITNSTFEANQGQDAKWGAQSTPVVITGNTFIHDCMRNLFPVSGIPATFNANLQDPCRAFDTFTGHMIDGGSITFSGNTIVSMSPTIFDMACDVVAPATTCPKASLTLTNNVVLGYDDPNTYPYGGKAGGPGALYFITPIGNIIRTNNVWYGMSPSFTAVATEQIADPLFVNEPKTPWPGAEADFDLFNTNFQAETPVPAGVGAPGQVVPEPVIGSATVVVTPPVGPTAPTITWPTPSPIVAGTPIGAAQLNATASVPGTFNYFPSAGAVPSVGTSTLTVFFTPTNTTLTATSKSVQLVVTAKANPLPLNCTLSIPMSVSAAGVVTFGTATCR